MLTPYHIFYIYIFSAGERILGVLIQLKNVEEKSQAALTIICKRVEGILFYYQKVAKIPTAATKYIITFITPLTLK